MDKRPFLNYLNNLKDRYPSKVSLIESIQNTFDDEFEAITNAEKLALMNLPEQFVKRIPLEDNNWTSQLHIWGEQCVPQLLSLDPMYLSFKNSFGDTVLMSLIAGATGAFKEQVDYDLIEEILNTDFDYEDVETDKNKIDSIVIKNPLDEKDINNQTPLDYLIDFAYSNGQYEGHEPDYELIELLEDWMNRLNTQNLIDVGSDDLSDEEIQEVPEVESENIVEDEFEYPEEIYNEPYSEEIETIDDDDGDALRGLLREEGFNDRL